MGRCFELAQGWHSPGHWLMETCPFPPSQIPATMTAEELTFEILDRRKIVMKEKDYWSCFEVNEREEAGRCRGMRVVGMGMRTGMGMGMEMEIGMGMGMGMQVGMGLGMRSLPWGLHHGAMLGWAPGAQERTAAALQLCSPHPGCRWPSAADGRVVWARTHRASVCILRGPNAFEV